MEPDIPKGSIVVRDTTAAHKAPMEVHKSIPFLGDLVGPRDLLVYVVGVAMVVIDATVVVAIWPWISATFSGPTAGVVGFFTIVVPALGAATLVIIREWKMRDLPQLLTGVATRLPTASTRTNADPNSGAAPRYKRNGSSAYVVVIPDDSPTWTVDAAGIARMMEKPR